MLEFGLYEFARMAPAMSRIARTAMFIVIGGVAVAIVYAMRSRSGNDRRQTDRRHEFDSPGES
ncbi:MAG TPA: hypothetical protein VIP11_22805 [Gemmatimonadaceae bacterium]